MKRVSLLLLAMICLALVPAWPALAEGIHIPYANTDIYRYYLEIDTRNQIATVYERDANNQYSKIVRQMLCTTGGKGNSTPRGTFEMGIMRERFGYFANYNVYAQYWSQVVRGVYIHSVLYSKRDENTMQPSTYRNLGRAVSHGCIRMLVEDARFIYYNLPPGTKCVVTSSKPRNEALRAALRPKVPAGEYRPAPDPNPEPTPLPAVVTAKTAPLMTGFSSKDRRITTLKYGQALEVIQYGTRWHKVRLPNKREGYLLIKYLSVGSSVLPQGD